MKWIRAIFTNTWKIYVGIVFSITALALYPFFLFILSLPRGKQKSFRLFVFWSRLMQLFCLYPSRKNKTIQTSGKPFVLIANHTSYLDIFLMFGMFPNQPFLFIGKSEILGYPILNTYFKNLNIPVDRSNKNQAGQAFVRAKKAIEDGFSICIFPEGGIPDLPAPEMARFKDGAFLLALKTKTPIVPVSLINNYRLFSDPNEPFGPARPGVARAYVHDLVYVTEEDWKEKKRKCHDLIQSKLS